jgi:hypothetical protein
MSAKIENIFTEREPEPNVDNEDPCPPR